MTTISVLIPCIEKHIQFLGRCIKSIREQTLLPSEVVISISNITEKNDSYPNTRIAVEKLIGKYRDKLDIIIYYTSDIKYAGQNRNICVGLSTGDIISFIDADDVMYSNRLNILDTIFRVCPKCIGILHYFTENAALGMEPDQTYEDNKIWDYTFSELIHYGHPSFRRKIFNKYKYSDAHRTQDFGFIETIIPEYREQLLVYRHPLTCYYSNDSTFFCNNMPC
jgi:glycosyltransferase involved in cell wall biosynthesis